MTIPYGESVSDLSILFQKGGADTWKASIALGYNPSEDALEVLIREMKSPSADFRRAAAEAVRNHPEGKRAASTLTELLTDESPVVVRVACASLAALECAQAHDAVLQILEVDDPQTRIVGIESIARLWRKTDFEVLLRLHDSDNSSEVRKSSAWALRSHADTENWKELFVRWQTATVARHKEWACELAGEFGDQSCIPILSQLSLDENGHVKKAAITASQKILCR